MFQNALFSSAPQAQAMPQYVNQPSSEAPTKADPLARLRGQAVLPSAPAQPFNPYQSVPAWAQSSQGAMPAASFANPLFNSQVGAVAPVQLVQQPGSGAPASTGGK